MINNHIQQKVINFYIGNSAFRSKFAILIDMNTVILSKPEARKIILQAAGLVQNGQLRITILLQRVLPIMTRIGFMNYKPRVESMNFLWPTRVLCPCKICGFHCL
jgi:hypothetical protein